MHVGRVRHVDGVLRRLRHRHGLAVHHGGRPLLFAAAESPNGRMSADEDGLWPAAGNGDRGAIVYFCLLDLFDVSIADTSGGL